jgi:hypothetical protein
MASGWMRDVRAQFSTQNTHASRIYNTEAMDRFANEIARNDGRKMQSHRAIFSALLFLLYRRTRSI